jgi:hypothetical protein
MSLSGLRGLVGAPALVLANDLEILRPSAAGARADDEAILRRLESDRFTERQRAMTELRRRGLEGIPLLQRAAEQGEAESRTRALQLLERYYRNESEDQDVLSEAAREALEALATGEGTAARRAHRILHPQPENPQARAQIANLQAMRIQAQLRLRAAQQVPQARRVPGLPGNRALPNLPRPVPAVPEPGPAADQVEGPRPKNLPQRKRMSIRQGGMKVEIVEDPEGIRVEVTETKDGEAVTERFEAKDAEELRKQHPRAFEHYQRMGMLGGMPRRPGDGNQNVADRLAEMIRQQIETFDARIEQLERQLAERGDNPEPAEGVSPEQLRKQIETFRRARQQLEDRLK